MGFFNNFSIKNKLRIIILFISMIVLILASTTIIVADFITFQQQIKEDLLVLADLVGINSNAGLIYLDPVTTEENIAGLKANSHIMLANIYKNGNLFASYIKEKIPKDIKVDSSNIYELFDFYNIFEKAELGTFKLLPDKKITILNPIIFEDKLTSKDYIHLIQPIKFRNKIIGVIHIQSDLKNLERRLWWEINIAIIALLIALVSTLILASRFQSIITKPIYNLLKTMKAVSNQKDYSLRAEKLTNDELGNLVDGFNKMLTQVESRDKELAQYQNHLEEMVKQRTSQLEKRSKELSVARDQALAANRAKSAFLANMSHELRTPLNGILGYAQILNRDKSLNKSQKDGINIIQRSGDYLLTLISDILDISKIEAGKLEVISAEFYLEQFLNSIAELFKIRAEKKGIIFDYKFSSQLPTVIFADEKRLRQIVINLLGNAIKFTNDGTVSFKVNYEGDNKFAFMVADTGVGISEDEIEKIFQPFQQVGDENYKAEGTGLGLSITKKLVELMEGKLKVESVFGHGSVFSVILEMPVLSTEKIKLEEKLPTIIGYTRSQEIENEPIDSCIILVVDDRIENRLVIINLLTPLGFNVIAADGGKQAVEKATEFQPDIILMDLMMPGMDGFETTRQVRKISGCEHIPIFALSASVFEYHREESKKAGCTEFVNKPVDENQLLPLMGKYLDLTWIHDETEEQITQDVIDKTSETEETVEPIELPTELVSELYQLVMMGDITGINEFSQKLEQTDAKFISLAKEINQLADEFELDKLQEIAQKFMDEAT
ncbi:MAG: response regulator [Thiomargarita sp.]|nr:response regulator [Thiomargarita sp.]